MTNPLTEVIPPAVATLTSAFETDPIVSYMLNSLTPTATRLAYIPTLFTGMLTASCLNGGWIISTTPTEGGNPGACALVLPPGGDPTNPWTMFQSGALGLLWNLGWGGFKRIIVDYAGNADAAKMRAMGMNLDGSKKTEEEKERYYYVFILGTKPEEQGKGLGSALMEEVKRVCKEDGNASCWLEATSLGSRASYERLGWKLMEEVTIGQGRAGADGLPKEGGKGVKYWAMLYRPSEEAAAKVEGAL